MKNIYRFIQHDGGKADAHAAGLILKKETKGDCVIRALAIATDTPYIDAYNAVREDGGYVSGAGAFFGRFVHALEWQGISYHGVKFIWQAFPAEKGKPRMNPVRFCAEYADGVYICRTAKHVFCVKRGVLYDTWAQRPDRCIYGAWKVTK